jgi:hypothetical protein
MSENFFRGHQPETTSSAGWWYTYPSEKYELVSWDYEFPSWMET